MVTADAGTAAIGTFGVSLGALGLPDDTWYKTNASTLHNSKPPTVNKMTTRSVEETDAADTFLDASVGKYVGEPDGLDVGRGSVGIAVGAGTGVIVGAGIGAGDGIAVGTGIGAGDGKSVGEGDGAGDGNGVGAGDGENVSALTESTLEDAIAEESRRWPAPRRRPSVA